MADNVWSLRCMLIQGGAGGHFVILEADSQTKMRQIIHVCKPLYPGEPRTMLNISAVSSVRSRHRYRTVVFLRGSWE